MRVETFVRRTRLNAAAESVFDWHLRPGAFERLTPPWESVRVIDTEDGVVEGSRAELAVTLGPFTTAWIAEHRDIVPGRQFRDVQIRGPFAHWEHTHRFEPDGPNACYLEDRIEYALPGGMVGNLLAKRSVRKKLERVFAYRHTVTAQDIAALASQRGHTPMNILVSGSTGLVGTALIPLLTTQGHEVVRLVRSKSKSPSKEMIHWNPEANYIDAAGLEGLDAVVHLAGENIAGARWSASQKARIRDSRVNGTRLLCETLSQLAKPPTTLVCASAIGFYGDRGDELITETSAPGTSFLCDVCREWEAAAEPARQKGIRVVHARFGIILSPAGGALAKMLFPFKMGVGGVIGTGRQYMSWITLDDAVGAIAHALTTPTLSGPVNVVAPHPVTNHEFTKTMGKVLGRPTILPMPAFAARLAFGEMANELLLGGANVKPVRLQESGYSFRFPELETGLRHVLGR